MGLDYFCTFETHRKLNHTPCSDLPITKVPCQLTNLLPRYMEISLIVRVSDTLVFEKSCRKRKEQMLWLTPPSSSQSISDRIGLNPLTTTVQRPNLGQPKCGDWVGEEQGGFDKS